MVRLSGSKNFYKKNSGIVHIALLFLISPSFFIGGPDYDSSRSIKELWNLGHVLFFALFTLWLYNIPFFQRLNVYLKIILSALLCIFIGTWVEIIQYFLPDRNFSLIDIALNFSGLTIVQLYFARSTTPSKRTRRTINSFILAIVLVLVIPLVIACIDEYYARKDFPTLANFKRPFEINRWKNSDSMKIVKEIAGRSKHAAQIQFNTDRYSGVTLFHFPRDWRGWNKLVFIIYNPGNPVVLHYRVHDKLHEHNRNYQNRFNGITELKPGWNSIEIPLESIKNGPKLRLLDLSNVVGMGLFLMNQKEKITLYISNIRLL